MGEFEVEVSPAQQNGEELDVTLVDEFENESESAETTAPDSTAPNTPTDLAVSNTGTALTGKGEAGSTVTVIAPNGSTIGSAVVDDEGNFSLPLTPAQVDKESLSVTLTDDSGNVSEPATASAPDLTAPDAPTNLAVSGNGLTVTGEGEVGTTATVRAPDGSIIGTAIVDEEGEFSVPVTPAQISAELLKVTLTDDSFNTSDSSNVTAPQPPSAPDVNDIDIAFEEVAVEGENVFMSVINGTTGEPGSTVTIKDAEGNVVGDTDVVVDEEGNYSVPLNEVYTDGEQFFVTFTNEAGTSESTPVTAPVIDPLLAVNNDEQVVLDIIPNVIDNGVQSEVVYSFVNIGAGGVASVDVVKFERV